MKSYERQPRVLQFACLPCFALLGCCLCVSAAGRGGRELRQAAAGANKCSVDVVLRIGVAVAVSAAAKFLQKSLKARRVVDDAFGRVQEQIAHELQEVLVLHENELVLLDLRPVAAVSAAQFSNRVSPIEQAAVLDVLGEVIHRLWILAIETSEDAEVSAPNGIVPLELLKFLGGVRGVLLVGPCRPVALTGALAMPCLAVGTVVSFAGPNSLQRTWVDDGVRAGKAAPWRRQQRLLRRWRRRRSSIHRADSTTASSPGPRVGCRLGDRRREEWKR